jgi:hypothetical protein
VGLESLLSRQMVDNSRKTNQEQSSKTKTGIKNVEIEEETAMFPSDTSERVHPTDVLQNYNPVHVPGTASLSYCICKIPITCFYNNPLRTDAIQATKSAIHEGYADW